MTPGAWAALAAVLVVDGLFVLNNLGPYLGTNYVGAMTMYSNLSATADNHAFMPSLGFADASHYVRILRFSPGNLKTTAALEFEEFVDWAAGRRRPVSLSFVRYHASRVCASANRPRVGLTLERESGERAEFRDLCSERSMLRYPPLTGYPECKGGCDEYLRRWAAGRERG